jgi:hypothetical protein
MQDSFQAYLDRVRGIVAQHGHMVQAVGSSPQECFAYTVGLTPALGCELFIAGLPQGTAMALLNDLAAKLRRRLIPDGENIDDVAAGLPLRLQTYAVTDSARGIDRSELVAVALRLGYPVQYIRQMVWPDRKGRFPGEAGYDHPHPQSIDLLVHMPAKH